MSLTRSASGFWPVLGRKALAMSVFAGNCPGIERDFRRRCDLGQRPIRSFRRGSTCRSEPPGSGIGYRTDLIETLEVSMRECRLQLPTISRDNGQIHPLERISLESLSENQIHRHYHPCHVVECFCLTATEGSILNAKNGRRISVFLDFRERDLGVRYLRHLYGS